MIYFDDDSIKIGGVILPGIYKSMEINHDAQVDEQEVEGSSKKPKQATGYDDAKITIEISLRDSETVTKEDKLLIIQNLFRTENQGVPQVHELVSTHSSIRGINKIIVKNMTSKETNRRNEIVVNLELMQYETMTIKASKGKKSGSSSSSGNNLSTDYKNYLQNNRGKAPKKSNKTSASPLAEDR